jgi:hypothetical protein
MEGKLQPPRGALAVLLIYLAVAAGVWFLVYFVILLARG